MKISEFSVKHSLLVNLISIFILLAGFFTIYIYQIKREAFPEVSMDEVIIQTPYPGASPAEVEKLVTAPLEDEILGVDGIDSVKSTSRDNMSAIMIEISEDADDKQEVVDDIETAVDRVVDLPEGAEEPMVTEITSGEIPILSIALSGDVSEFDLHEYAENLEDALETTRGVSSVSELGLRDKEVWVEVDPDKLAEYHVSMEEIMLALQKRNRSIPGGKLRSDKEKNIRTTGEFYTEEEIENVIIRANDIGNWLKVKDVADVRFYFEDEDVVNKSFGTRAIVLTVVKRSSADAIKVVDDIMAETSNYVESVDEELKLNFFNDISYYIKRRLGVLKNNGIIGFILVVSVLMFFLNYRTAVLTALGIPIAFAATLTVMALCGISVNLITMFGLIVVLGMLVDDGIIVAENCSRHLEEGLEPKEAAIKGTEEVMKPVITAVVTTTAAFAPLLFLPGIIGRFVRGIPIVVIIALAASLLEALVILPSHFADFVKLGKINKVKSERHLPWFSKVVKFYTRVMNKALSIRYAVIFGLIVLLAATGLLAKYMDFTLFGSEEGIEQFYIRVETTPSTNLYKTNELIGQIEDIVAELPESQLDSYTTQVGMYGHGWFYDEYGKRGSHVGQVSVYLTPFTERSESVSDIIENLRSEVEGVEGFERVIFEMEEEGPPTGRAIAVEIRGDSFETLKKIAAEAATELAAIKGVTDIASNYEEGKEEIRVVVDEKKATSSFVQVGEVAATIRNAFSGGVSTTIKPTTAEEEIDVRVRYPEDMRDKKEIFDKILVPNSRGDLIPLKKIADIEEKTVVSSIHHLDGKRSITVRAGVKKGETTSAEANAILAEKLKDVPKRYPGYTIHFGGEQEENVRMVRAFMSALILALFLIFMILAAAFNSIIQPLIVMMAIPFGLIGVVWAFYFHGLPIGFFMMMGFVGLMGIVVNDSIVLVDFINGLRRSGTERRHSIIRAGQLRLRPVILTTVTTSLGLVPTAYGIGGGDPFLKPMALTIVWGIICASALTLIAIPCIYAIIDDIWLKLSGHATVVKSKNNHNNNPGLPDR